MGELQEQENQMESKIQINTSLMQVNVTLVLIFKLPQSVGRKAGYFYLFISKFKIIFLVPHPIMDG